MLSLTFQKIGETIGSLCSGGPGLLIVGMLDGSIVPTFGSLDQFAAVLSAREQSQWLYYAGDKHGRCDDRHFHYLHAGLQTR